MADELRLAFMFIPDGEVIPPDAFGPDTIRLPAVYYPDGLPGRHRPERPPNTPAAGMDGPGIGFEQHHGAASGNASGWFKAFAPSSKFPQPRDRAMASDGFADHGWSGRYDDTSQGAPTETTGYRDALYPAPAGQGGSYEVRGFTSSAIGAAFAGPGVPSDQTQSDPRIVAVQEQITKAAQHVMDQVNEGKIIVPANRTTAGSRLHDLFAKEIESMHIPGVTVEQSFSLGGLVNYGADGSIRTDVILHGTDGDAIAVWDFKTGNATNMPDSRIRAIIRGVLGDKASKNDIPVIVTRMPLDLALQPKP